MRSAPHAFGIDGTAASGRRANFDSGCLLDCDFIIPLAGYPILITCHGGDAVQYMYHLQVMNVITRDELSQHWCPHGYDIDHVTVCCLSSSQRRKAPLW